MKSYIFKCGLFENQSPCKGKHLVELNEIFYMSLFYRLLFNYEITLSKQICKNIIDEFELFFDNKVKQYENGKLNLNHFNSIDLPGELIYLFCEEKFKVTNNDNKKTI